MKRAFSIEGIDTLTEGAGEASLDWPQRRSIRGAGPIGERGETMLLILQTGGSGSGEGRATKRVQGIQRCLVLLGLHIVIGGQQALIGFEAVESRDLTGDGAERSYLNILLF